MLGYSYLAIKYPLRIEGLKFGLNPAEKSLRSCFVRAEESVQQPTYHFNSELFNATFL